MNTLNVGHFLIINFRQNYLAQSETQTSITRFLILRSLPVKSNNPIMPSHKRPISTFLRITDHSPWSICLLPWPERRVNGRCGGNHQPCIFQVDDDGTMFCNSSIDMIPFFLFPIFPGRSNSKGFHLFSLSKHTTLHPIGQGTKVRILPTSKYVYPNYTFWDWKSNQKMS